MKLFARMTHGAAILALLWGCSGGEAPVGEQAAVRHDTKSPRKAIVGHWISEDGKTHYYFSEDRIVSVDINELNYSVVDSDEKKDALKVKTRTPSGWHEDTYLFSNSRSAVTKVFQVSGTTLSVKLKYVDGKTQP